MKLCSRCRTEKEDAEFNPRQKNHWCAPCRSAYARKWYSDNRDSAKEKGAARYRELRVKDAPRRKVAYARWARNNPGKVYVHCVSYRARKKSAFPKWANRFFIAEAYDLARRRTEATGIKWNVDHIVPLKSPLVCGLHVEHNLRVIPATVNQQKKNVWWPEMP